MISDQNTIRLANPIDRPRLVRATCPFPNDANLGNLGRAADGRRVYAQVFARFATHKVAEVFLWADEDDVGENTLEIAVLDETPKPDGAPEIDRGLLAALDDPGEMDLVGQFHVSLTKPRDEFTRFEVWNPLCRRWVHTEDLGAYGAMSWSMEVRAGTTDVRVVLNWTNGQMPDIRRRTFTVDEVALSLAAEGVTWTKVLPDPVMVNGEWLVRPNVDGPYLFPQRFERSFRFVVHERESQPDLRDVCLGVADWSLGGWLASGIPVPDLSGVNFNSHNEARRSREALANLEPWEGGGEPVDALWPAAGSRYGGMTGGTGREQFPGVRFAGTGTLVEIEREMIEQLRIKSRNGGAVYDENGRPLDWNTMLEDGRADWMMSNRRFQYTQGALQYGPFRWPQTSWDPERKDLDSGDHPRDPRVFDPIDMQHQDRETSPNRALAWACNDWLAKQYLMCDGELARADYWEGPGRANGMAPFSIQPGKGVAWGRARFWSGETIMTSGALGGSTWAVRYRDWLEALLFGVERARMPNGMVTAQANGSKDKAPPYGDGNRSFYYSHRPNESCFLLLVMESMRKAGIEPVRTLEVTSNTLRGFARMVWWPGRSGWIDRAPFGPNDGSGFRWSTWEDVPGELQQAMFAEDSPLYSTCYQGTGSIGIGLLLGDHDAHVMARRVTRKAPDAPDVEVASEILSWGKTAPNFASSSPIEAYVTMRAWAERVASTE